MILDHEYVLILILFRKTNKPIDVTPNNKSLLEESYKEKNNLFNLNLKQFKAIVRNNENLLLLYVNLHHTYLIFSHDLKN